MEEPKIKKYSQVYDLLQDLNEYELSKVIEDKLNKQGYTVFVVRDKYKFKFVGFDNKGVLK